MLGATLKSLLAGLTLLVSSATLVAAPSAATMRIAPPLAGDPMAMDALGGGATAFHAGRERWADRNRQRVSLSAPIRAEGDSYMSGAYSTSLARLIARATGRLVLNTAKGASSMEEIRDRIVVTSGAGGARPGGVTVIWDGSNNGMASVSRYADALQQAVDALGHDRFVIIPAMSGSALDAVAAEFRRRWPGHVLDWRDVLGAYHGTIPAKYLAHPDARGAGKADRTHLNDTAMVPMADAIAKFIAAKGW